MFGSTRGTVHPACITQPRKWVAVVGAQLAHMCPSFPNPRLVSTCALRLLAVDPRGRQSGRRLSWRTRICRTRGGFAITAEVFARTGIGAEFSVCGAVDLIDIDSSCRWMLEVA